MLELFYDHSGCWLDFPGLTEYTDVSEVVSRAERGDERDTAQIADFPGDRHPPELLYTHLCCWRNVRGLIENVSDSSTTIAPAAETVSSL